MSSSTTKDIVDINLDKIEAGLVFAEKAINQAKLVYQLAEDVIESQGNCSTHPDADDVWVDRDALNKLADAIGYKKSSPQRGAG